MRLSELLVFDDIVIQCHDNPDADALASGYALYLFFKRAGKEPYFMYRGFNKIGKSNLMIMLSEMEIPVHYEPDFDRVPELLITVDCQYGQRNVTKTEAKNVAIIDHHQVTVELPKLSEVRSNIGSCATVVWDLMREEGFPINADKVLMTALYYGLYSDTNKLSEMAHPLDRDMSDSLMFNEALIKQMSNSNISLGELLITGRAFLSNEYIDKDRCMVVEAEACDPCILGVISDFVLETDKVDVCVAFYSSPLEVKFSVRSCSKEVHANELAAFLAEGLGGGGGHLYKAGGTIRPEKLSEPAKDVIMKRLHEYYEAYTIMYAKDTVLDRTGMKLYEKVPQQVGVVRLRDIFPEFTRVDIRTLEGDISTQVESDTFLMIGIEGEVYPIKEEKLRRSYEVSDKPYEHTFEYAPSVKNAVTGDRFEVCKFAKAAVGKGGARIWAKPLTNYVKLFTAWDEEKYYAGVPGDYIACREDDEHDIYIIRSTLFDQLYFEVK
ncbi:MAG: DHH family phosphoesterase [Clostridiales bacterium]|nr:DHH family phosphoesterase [Clostridiales bacterium]